MAHAISNIIQTVSIGTVTLEMSLDEARALRGLLGAFGRNSEVANVQLLSDVKNALEKETGWVGRVQVEGGSITEVDPNYQWGVKF